MKKTISIFAFAPYALRNGERVQISLQDKKIRPVMSRSQVIAPLCFFENVLGVSVKADGASICLTHNGRTLCASEGEKEYAADGVRGEFSVPVRREKGVLCMPAAETVRALGMSARQFDRLVVIGEEAVLESLASDEQALSKLTRETCGVFNAAYFTAEDFKAARDSWRRELCGDSETNDLSIPGMRTMLEMMDQDSEDLRRRMNREKDAVILFGTEAPTESGDLNIQYGYVLRMAQPYGAVGCRGYKSKELLSDILHALDWMHDHMYGASVLSDESFRSYKLFNWWHWYVGAASILQDIVMIIAEDIGRELVDKYVLPVSFIRTQMRVERDTNTANSRTLPMTPLALLTEDRALLQSLYLDMESLLEEHDSGNNMRRDWCCMTHGMPYNICYGTINMSRTGKVLGILENSPLAYPLPKKYNLMKMMRYTFAPVVYRGRSLNLMDGRFMQSNAGMAGARTVLNYFHNIFGMFGEEEDRELYEILYRNATPEIREGIISTFDTEITLEDYRRTYIDVKFDWKRANTASYTRYLKALTDPMYRTAPYVLGYMWYSGDSCVQHRNDHMIGLRMCSERSPGYECINSANGDGWYTGDGALYLYTPDAPEQYGVKWWQHADKHLIPGTTVDARTREAMFFSRPYKNNQSFVGGVDLDGQFVTTTMDYEGFHCEVDEGKPDLGYGRSWPIHKCTLTAKKSYFMLDKAIVCIGTNVNAHDGYPVRTIVENYMLTDGLGGILVNGEQLAENTAEITREDIQSIYLPGAGGYLFPQGGKVTIRVYGDEVKYISFWLEHGVDPENGAYAYILLPNASAEETAKYDLGDIEFLSNDEKVQSVRERHSGLTGVIFREAGRFEGVTAEQPMIVMLRRDNGALRLNACDPTQKLDGFGFAAEGVKEIVSADPRMTAEADGNSVRFTVDCDSAKGRGYRAELVLG